MFGVAHFDTYLRLTFVFNVFFSFLFSSKLMHVFLAVNIVKKSIKLNIDTRT